MLVRADSRKIPLPDASVQCVVTSPPYWGLRRYRGSQDLVWYPPRIGVETLEAYPPGTRQCETCEHVWREETVSAKSNWETFVKADGSVMKAAEQIAESSVFTHAFCAKNCGAWRGSYGLEPTIDMHVIHTIEILREIRRVLRNDGVVFWNVGDSYYSGDSDIPGAPNRSPQAGLKPKDLCLIPARMVLAAQQDGWWVRSLIIWSKPNAMPESATDRPTDAYEHIVMLTKSKRYFWDAEAVREPKAESTVADLRNNGNGQRRDRDYHGAATNGETNLGGSEGGRNMRNVWTFPTQPYSGAHFATYPEEIPRRAILAATSARGACSRCGAPWERITEPSPVYAKLLGKSIILHDGRELECGRRYTRHSGPSAEYLTAGWRPTCNCRCVEGIASRFYDGELTERACFSKRLQRRWYRERWQARIDSYWPRAAPCLVLDPFGGSGTTGRVAVELNRRAVLLDIAYSADAYAPLARERTIGVQRTMFR